MAQKPVTDLELQALIALLNSDTATVNSGETDPPDLVLTTAIYNILRDRGVL